jgi:hypothetical protein
MPRPEYAPFITSPRGAAAPMPAGSAPSAVSALSAAASETFSAALSVAKLNLHRRRRQTLTGERSANRTSASRSRDSRNGGRRTPYLDQRDDEDEDDPFEPPRAPQQQQQRYRNQPRPRKPVRSPSSSAPSPSAGRRSGSFASMLMSSSSSLSARSPSARSSSATSPSSLRDFSSSSMVSDMAQNLPELSADRIEALVNFIDRSVDDAYNLSLGFGRVRWTPSRSRDNVTIHRARSGQDDALLDAAVRGSCNISATFRELSDLLITETTADFADHESAVNPSEFRDGQVLYTLVPRTPEERFVCVKWHCVRSLASSVARDRDYVYVELVDSFEDGDGRRIGYRLSKSVDLEVPLPNDKRHYVRAKTLTLQTWSERAPGSLEFVTMMINDLGDRLPSWLVHKMVDTAAMRSACIRDHINQRRIDMLVYAEPRNMVPLSRRVCCVVCTRSFSLVRKKYNCAGCGDVICSQCSVHELVTSHQRSSDPSAPGGKRKTRICVKCNSKMRSRELPRRASSARQSDISRVSSEGSIRGSLASNNSFLARSHVSAGKISDETRRSFLSDSTAGTSSQDSSTSVDDANRSSGNGSSAVRKQVPNMFQFRPTSSSMGKTERSSKASTSPSSPGDEEDRLDVEELQPQVLSDSILAPTPVELDLGVGKYKETFTQQPTRAERDYEAEAAELAEYSDSDEEEYAEDDAGNFLNTESFAPDAVRQSLSQATVMTLDMDVPTVHKVEVASFLTEEENANLDTLSNDSDSAGFTLDENSKIVKSRSFGGRADVGAPIPVQVEELMVEEVLPENVRTVPRRSLELQEVEVEELVIEEVQPVNVGIVPRRSMDSEELVVEEIHPEAVGVVPRRSLESEELVVEEIQPENMRNVPRRSLETEVEEMEVPMVVRKVAKRLVVGSGGRRSRDSRRAPAPRPSGAPPPPPKVADMLTDSMASARANKKAQAPANGSRAAPPPAPTPAPAAPEPEEEVLKVEDLQVHLDRMNQISANLLNLRKEMQGTVETPASTQTAMAALTTFETKANAERAAKIAANFISLLDRNAAPAARRAQQQLMQRTGPRTSLFNVTLAMGDGSFVDYLVDSTFEDVGESPDGTGIGWQSVLSQTTGRQYFFNQNCALASWTLPGPDVFRGMLYMVL